VSVPSGSHASLHDDWREPKVDAGSAAIVIASCPRPRWPTGARPCSPTVSATRAATAPQPRAPRQAAGGPPRSRGGRCDHDDRAVHGSWLGGSSGDVPEAQRCGEVGPLAGRHRTASW